MATGTLAPFFRTQWFDSNGHPLASGTLEFYLAGTVTPVATYSDVGLMVANPTTITLNSAGRPQVSGTEVAIYLTPGVSYKVICKNSAGTLQWTQDNVTAVPPTTIDLDYTGTAGENIAAGDAVYLATADGRWYRTDGDAAASSSTAVAVGFAPNAIGVGATGTIRRGGRITGLAGLTPGTTYYASGTVGALTATRPAFARVMGIADSTTTLLIQPDDFTRVGNDLVCQGRLTLATGVPVTTGDVTAAGTIYFTPYGGNRVALFNGSEWVTFLFTERSLALVITSGTNYDVFLYDNAGTLTLELTAWTNDTTRATALTTQDGVYVKTGATTRRYLGTIRASGANTTEDSAANRFVWNYYNRVARPMRVLEATNTWTYTTATWRQARATATNQLGVVVGVAEDGLEVHVGAEALQDNGSSVRVGVGEDSTSAPSVNAVGRGQSSGGSAVYGVHAHGHFQPAVGYHFYAWLEWSAAAGTTTWHGDNGGTDEQSGITGMWRA